MNQNQIQGKIQTRISNLMKNYQPNWRLLSFDSIFNHEKSKHALNSPKNALR